MKVDMPLSKETKSNQMNMLWFFRSEKFPPGSDGELTEQPLPCSILTRYFTDIDENQYLEILVEANCDLFE